MKSKSPKRIGALFLSFALCLSLLPTTAFAANNRTVNSASELRDAVNSAGNGDTITLGADIDFPVGDSETIEGVYKSRFVTTTVYQSWIRERLLLGWTRYDEGITSTVIHLPDDPDGISYKPGEPNTRSRDLDATCGILIENKNLTIDLNGHTLSGTGGAGGAGKLYSVLFVTGNSQVTIQGDGRIESNTGTAVTAYDLNAKVTINSGYFKGSACALTAIANATFVISGGTFEGPNWTEGTGEDSFQIKYTKDGVPGPEGVGGEKFTRWRIHYTINGTRTYPVYGGTLYSESGFFTISGNPTFKAPEGGAIFSNAVSMPIVKIEGGTFEGTLHGLASGGIGFQIKGGTFTDKPYKNDLVDGFVLFGSNGRYEIKPLADVSAKITSGSNETYYTSLSDAIADVKDGETVILLKDQPVVLSSVSNYTLDLNGMTISNPITASAGTVTIKNGTVNCTSGNAITTSGSAKLTVNCTVNASSGTALYAGGGTLTANGGTYRGKLNASGGTLSLTGGKYSADPSNYLLEGSYAEKGSDDLYSIKVGTNPSGYMEIHNADQLLSFAAAVNGGRTDLNAILMNDINLDGINWTPIASADKPYAGTFDGNGYEIQNLNVNLSAQDGTSHRVGLFASVSGTVQNLRIASGFISATASFDGYGGGITGELNGGTILNCSNAASITVVSDRRCYVGGIAGGGDGGNIERCSNEGTITAKDVSPSNKTGKVSVAGILGETAADAYYDKTSVKNCYNNGNINYDLGEGGTMSAGAFAIARFADKCYNTGHLSGEDEGSTQTSDGFFIGRDQTENNSTSNSYYLFTDGDTSDGAKTTEEFASGEVAYLLNGGDAPDGPWYQTLGEDDYPVLDPTHAAVYYRNGDYVNATYSSVTNPTITTDGGISLVELVSQLPQMVDVTSTIGNSAADVTWNTDNIQYDPEDFNAQTFTINGTANVTGLLNGGEKTVTATVNVKAVTVNGLTVTTAPNLTYSQGGKLDLGGVKATAQLSNGKAQIVEHDTEGVTFALDGQTIEDGASLDKEQHNGKTLTLSYGGKTVELGTLAVRSTNNFISALTVSGQEAQYENGGYAVTLPPYSSLPDADGITVTLADPSATVTGKTQISAGDSEARWQITVQAENGDPATYLLTVTVSPDYDRLNQTAVDEFTEAWNSLGEMSWTPTQAEVQQDETTAGVSHEVQLTYWLTDKLFKAGLEIPNDAEMKITYTSGPNWATEGSRQDHDGTPGSFTFTVTFTATGGEESQYQSVSFTDNAGTITPTPYDAPAYTVYFDPQNGSAVSSVQVTEDTLIGDARPADPTRTDYRFTGWYTEAECLTPWNFNDAVTENNMTLYAGWRWSQSHTEIDVARTQIANEDAFDAGEYGEGPRMGDTVTITAQATLTEEPGQTNTWNADPETFTFYLGDPDHGGELLNEVTATEEGSVYTAELKVALTSEAGFAEGENTVYAVFSGGDGLDSSRASVSLDIGKAMFTVTFSNTGDSEIENQYVEDGQTASRPSDPTWEDYRFTGWKDDRRDFDFDEEITRNTDLTATWEWARSDTGVSIRLEQAGNPDAPTESGVYHIGDTVSVTATVKLADQPGTSNSINLTPDQFAFYVGDPDNGGTHLGTVEASENSEGGYTATLNNNTLGTTEGLTDVGDYDIYAVFTGNDELNASQKHTSLTVRPRLYTVTFDSDGGSTVRPQYVEDGGTIEEPDAPTRQDYRFTGWADEDGSPYDFSTTVTGPVELTAIWKWSKSETGVSIMWVSAGNDAAGENGTPIRMGDTVSITASVELAAPSNSISLSPPEFVFYVGDPNHSGTSLGAVRAQPTESGYTASLDVKLTDGNGFAGAGTYTIYAVFSGSGELDESRSYDELNVAPAIYTVTFDSKGGTSVASQYIVDGQTITEPAEPTRGDGWYFGGWKQGERLWNFQRDTVDGKMTLSAAWSYVPVFDIDGSVTDDKGEALSNIQITLQRGKDIVFETVTNEQGQYKFEKVSPGLYNIVAERTVEQTKQTVTTLVEIIDADQTSPPLKMPPENVNSVLELPQDAPNIVVGGLTAEAIAVAGESENQDATVTVNMTVEPKAPVTGTPAEDTEDAQLQQEQQAIQQQAASRTLNFLEIAVVKEVTSSGDTNTTPITETSNILEIAVEFDFGNRENVTVYRYHDGQAQALTQTNARAGAAQDGTYYLDRENGLIHIFTQQFSLYAIGYTVPTPGGDTGGGGGVSTYRITVEDSEHGEVKSSRASASQGSTVTLTVKPDEGYELSELIVTDSRGNEIDLTGKGDGKFTFTMPGRAVTVEAIFTEIEEEPQPWNNPFVDVRAGAWYYDAVRYVHEHGLMAGTSAKTFDPNVITTRGMIVTILYRLVGCPDIENRNWGYPYADVDSTAYYGTAVYWARLCGIVAGYSSELFGPNDPITREQFAVMLYRFAGQSSVPDLTMTFSDADQVSGYASDAMRWAVGAGIINGKGNGILDPKGDATRAQAAAMLMRFCQKYMEK